MPSRSSRKAASGTKAPAISLPSGSPLPSGATSVWSLDDARLKGPVVLIFLRGFF